MDVLLQLILQNMLPLKDHKVIYWFQHLNSIIISLYYNHDLLYMEYHQHYKHKQMNFFIFLITYVFYFVLSENGSTVLIFVNFYDGFYVKPYFTGYGYYCYCYYYYIYYFPRDRVLLRDDWDGGWGFFYYIINKRIKSIL